MKKSGQKPPKIREIVLRDEKSGKTHIYLAAKISDEGDLIMEGQDVGEAPDKYWGDSDYEYWVIVKRDCKDTVLLWLIKECFGTSSDFRDWLKEDYRDTVLLWLIKERFKTSSDFRDWLKEKGIPSKFFSWA